MQAYPDMPQEKEHFEKALDIVGFMGFNSNPDKSDNTNKCLIANKDLETQNITVKDVNAIEKEVRTLFSSNPKKKVLSFSIISGHGMNKEGTQYILLNAIDNKKGFYKTEGVENRIRTWKSNYRNGYFIALFSGCREVYQ